MERRQIAVSAPAPEAAAAAMAVAEAGGNAVDAAIAAVCVATVTEVGIVSPMGGAYINIWAPGEEPVVLDAYVEMPGREAAPEQFGAGLRHFHMDYYGGFDVYGGHGAVATPGMFAGLDEASKRWGALPWSEVILPAAHVARTGWALGSSPEFYLRHSGGNLFGWDPDTAAFMTQGGHGTSPALGEIVRSTDLANSLETIARDTAHTLYTGELAHAIADDMAARDGLLGLADLAAYRTAVRAPLRTRLTDWDVAVNAPPSIGGPVLTAMLRLLAARRERDGNTRASDIIDIQHTVLEYRRRAIDAAEDLEIAGKELIRALEELGPEGLKAVSSSPDTIHVSATDDSGLCCAITTSAGYGSGVTVPGTGLMLNNALGEPELNRRGVHALPPGTRLASNMTPSTARREDGTMLAVGSPGADRITTALMQVIGGICLDDKSLQEAVDQPRLHVAFDDEGAAHIEHETGDAILAAVQRSGMPAVAHERIAMYFGGVGATSVTPAGTLEAAGDPRRAVVAAIG